MRHRHALLLVLAAVASAFAPLWLSGEVIFPHDNSVEVGQRPAGGDPHQRPFSDLSSTSIPELHHQLRGNREGWIATWNPHVELGRPAWHINGLSKAFALTHGISLVTDDALAAYTALALITVLLTATFGYLWLQARELRPAACLTGALGLSLGAFTLWWLTFVMVLAALCWTLGLLWLLQRFLERPSPARGLGIAFCVHALLLTAYPQQILWHGLLVAGSALAGLVRRPSGERLRTALELGAAVALGLASVAPVYVDFALDLSRSARLDLTPDFLLATRPWPASRGALALFLARYVDAFWLGNPLDPDTPLRFAGLCLTPLMSALLLLSFTGGQVRRLWPWQAFFAVCLLANLSPQLYRLGVGSGLLFSRALPPLAAATLPALLLAAHGANHLLRSGPRGRGLALALASLPALALLLGLPAAPAAPRPEFAAIGVAFVAATLVLAWTRSAALLVVLAVAGSWHYGARLLVSRPPTEIQKSSPLVELLARQTRDGSRYAMVFREPETRSFLLPPNQEIWLGLRSVHGYDSFASSAYQRWARRMGQRDLMQGRRFRALHPDARLDPDELARAGVRVLLSFGPLSPRLAARIGGNRELGVYRTAADPLREARFTRYRRDGEGAVPESPPGEVERVLDSGDRLRFALAPSPDPTLLFASQQYHPGWRAFADGRELATLPVHDFYQGVLVPPRTSDVELRFLPWVRFAWLPQALFGLAAAACAARRVRGRYAGTAPKRARGDRSGES